MDQFANWPISAQKKCEKTSKNGLRWQQMSNRLLDLTSQAFTFLELVDFERYAEGWCAAVQFRVSELHRRIPRESITAVEELQKDLVNEGA